MISKDEGSTRAPIVLIGEAYGHWEEVYGRPFVGPSYQDKLLPWWNDCVPKLDRSMFFITNTWDQGQPPGKIDYISEHDMRASMDRLHQRLTTLEGPDGGGPMVIVPVGNYALYALTGNGRVSFHKFDGRHKRPGIKDWRGSILQYTDLRGRQIKVIPSVHPASTFYSDAAIEWMLRKDWQRIAEDVQFRELRLPQYVKCIAPSKGEFIEWAKWTMATAAERRFRAPYTGRIACSMDVETPNKVLYEMRQKESAAATAKCAKCGHTRKWHDEAMAEAAEQLSIPDVPPAKCAKRGLKKDGALSCACCGYQAPLGKPRKVKVSEEAYLGCVGYCWDPRYTICVPTTLEYWQDPAVWAEVKAWMRRLHADPNIDFGGQNFGFDCWWAAEEDVPIFNQMWDLRKMHVVERPWSTKNDLASQASIDTRVPFWKHEAKLPDEISRWSHNKEQLWAYNCTDNYAQKTLLDVRVARLQERGRYEYYEDMEKPIEPRLLGLGRWGFRADIDGRAKHFEACKREAKQIGKEINDAAGFAADCKHKKCGCLVKKIAVSTDRLKWFLYEKLGLPVQYKKVKKEGVQSKSVSVDVVTIKRLMELFPGVDALQSVGSKTLKHRRKIVEANFVKAEAVDADGRCRAIFKQDTSLGRLSSSKTPKGTGRNLQNIDRKLRRFFLADTGDEVPS